MLAHGHISGDIFLQIRIEGRVERLSEQASTEYFHSRPKASQIGAWCSQQSSVIAGRKVCTLTQSTRGEAELSLDIYQAEAYFISKALRTDILSAIFGIFFSLLIGMYLMYPSAQLIAS